MKLEKAGAELDWNLDALSLERKIRAFNPVPVAWCDLAGERTRIWSARALATRSAVPPGQWVAANPDGIDIGTSKGLLRLVTLQRPGGRPVTAREYLQARTLGPGTTPAAGTGS
jgi:methionyl-tRNA formyltransferase